MVAVINTEKIGAFFTGNRPDDEIGFDSLSKICLVRHNTNTLAPSIEEKLQKNEVISELLSIAGQQIVQSNTLCKCQLRDTPLIILRTAQGPAETDPYRVTQRLNELMERARLQKDDSAQQGLTLAAKLEVETDRRTNRPYILLPQAARIIVTFFMSRTERTSDFRHTTAKITLQPHRALEYDLGTLSATMVGPQGFKRKMISQEITFLVKEYEKSMKWATEAIARKN